MVHAVYKMVARAVAEPEQQQQQQQLQRQRELRFRRDQNFIFGNVLRSMY